MANARGKAIILFFFVAAIGAALFSIWFLRGLRAEAIAFWGVPVALNIRDADQVELLLLRPAAEENETSERFADGSLAIRARGEINGAQGLLQLRLFLLDNGTFRFDESPPTQLDWTHALRFTQPDDSGLVTTLVFDPQRAVIWHLESDRKVDVAPQQEFIAYFLDDVGQDLAK